MANWFDIISLVVIVAIVGGVMYGASIVVKQVSEAVDNTKKTLKDKGVHISDKGVSVKTTARLDRDDYVDATQRGFIKAMGASSFGTADNVEDKKPVLSRQNSAAESVHTVNGYSGNTSPVDEKDKKKRLFRRKPSN